MTPEQLARQQIDAMLTAAGWAVQNYVAYSPGAARGIALRDGVNVGYDVYRMKTEVSEQSGKVEAGFHSDKRNRLDRTRLPQPIADPHRRSAGRRDRRPRPAPAPVHASGRFPNARLSGTIDQGGRCHGY